MNQIVINHFHISGDYIDIHDNSSVHVKEGHQFRATDTDIVSTYTPPIPQERKYSQVREYINERKKYDPEFKQFCDTHTLRDLCTKLTSEFGWFVDENSLSQNLNRHM